MIIGITGTYGAGKGAVVDYLKQRGFVQYSSSGTLGELVMQEGNPRTRDFLGPMATKLQQQYKGGVIEKNYKEKFLAEQPEHAIFESIHRLSEALFVKSVGGFVLAVDADLETRYERIYARQETEKDAISFETFKKLTEVEEEGGGASDWDNNIRSVIQQADHTIMNDGTLEELHQKIDTWLQTIV